MSTQICSRLILTLDPNEMICFCKTDKCNECEYKDEYECTKIEWNYGRGKSKLEVCYDLPCANRNLWKPMERKLMSHKVRFIK